MQLCKERKIMYTKTTIYNNYQKSIESYKRFSEAQKQNYLTFMQYQLQALITEKERVQQQILREKQQQKKQSIFDKLQTRKKQQLWLRKLDLMGYQLLLQQIQATNSFIQLPTADNYASLEIRARSKEVFEQEKEVFTKLYTNYAADPKNNVLMDYSKIAYNRSKNSYHQYKSLAKTLTKQKENHSYH